MQLLQNYFRPDSSIVWTTYPLYRLDEEQISQIVVLQLELLAQRMDAGRDPS
jgi:hypothetical protein